MEEKEEIKGILQSLISATESINYIKDNIKETETLKSKIEDQAKTITQLHESIENDKKTTESQLAQARALLEEVKQIQKSSTQNINVDEIKKQIEELLKTKENTKNSENKTTTENSNNNNSNDFVGIEFREGKYRYMIEEHLGKINNEYMALELNKISWNGSQAKYDIRNFTSDHKHKNKGVTITTENIHLLKDILNKTDIDSISLPDEYGNYEIKQNIAKLKNYQNWNLELNVMTYPNSPSKFDLRAWSDDHTHFGNGVTFTQNELKTLKTILNNKL